MQLQLIKGEFNANDALTLVTQMVQLKIQFHVNQINIQSNEEDIKRREGKIKQLLKALFDLRNSIQNQPKNLKIEAFINIE
jgi:hypothetical protein